MQFIAKNYRITYYPLSITLIIIFIKDNFGDKSDALLNSIKVYEIKVQAGLIHFAYYYIHFHIIPTYYSYRYRKNIAFNGNFMT